MLISNQKSSAVNAFKVLQKERKCILYYKRCISTKKGTGNLKQHQGKVQVYIFFFK